jgi:hypothetical protein
MLAKRSRHRFTMLLQRRGRCARFG